MKTLYQSPGGSTATAVVQGNGWMVNNNGQQIGREVHDVYPIRIRNKDGQGGHLEVSTEPQRIIASGLIDGTLITDQEVKVVGADKYIIRAVVFSVPPANPIPDAAMAGGVYTKIGKSGHILVPANQTFAALTNTFKVLEVPVNLGEFVTAPSLYVSLTTPNSVPIMLRCHIIGDVLHYAKA